MRNFVIVLIALVLVVTIGYGAYHLACRIAGEPAPAPTIEAIEETSVEEEIPVEDVESEEVPVEEEAPVEETEEV